MYAHLKTRTISEQQNKSIYMFNGTIFGILNGHLDHRISLVRNDVDQRQVMIDRIERECRGFVSLLLHQRIFDCKKQSI